MCRNGCLDKMSAFFARISAKLLTRNLQSCLMEWEIYQGCSSLWCNFWQSPDESPSLMLSLVHTQHVQVSANWFYPAFRFHHSCDVCRFGSVPWRADTDYYLAKDYNLMIIPCSWLCDGVLLKLFKILYYWHICLSAFYSFTGFSLQFQEFFLTAYIALLQLNETIGRWNEVTW